MLIFDGVTFRYRGASREAFTDFSWTVSPGRTVLLGPNGAGKSTILAIAASLLRPSVGTVRAEEITYSRLRTHRAYRTKIGWMPQQTKAVPNLSAREQVAYAGWLKGLNRRDAWDQSRRALSLVDLEDRSDNRTTQLSGGQLRRVGLAQAIVHQPSILLLDEPTVGLDPAQRARFRDILGQLDDALTILVSTHQVDDLRQLYDAVTVLDRGRVVFSGGLPDFLALDPHATEGADAERAYGSILDGRS